MNIVEIDTLTWIVEARLSLTCAAILKNYKVQEIFYSIAGEGLRTGRPAVFVRFAGCNLWSGREEDRAGAKCTFCDTTFTSMDGPEGGKYLAAALVEKVETMWPKNQGLPYVVFTGGEPALQLDEFLLKAFKAVGFETAIETNGTRPLPVGLDWVCVSPKGNLDEVVVREGQEVKMVYPQQQFQPEDLEDWNFEYFYLQPLWDERSKNWVTTQDYCLKHPKWRLSLQMHKVLGLK